MSIKLIDLKEDINETKDLGAKILNWMTTYIRFKYR